MNNIPYNFPNEHVTINTREVSYNNLDRDYYYYMLCDNIEYFVKIRNSNLSNGDFTVLLIKERKYGENWNNPILDGFIINRNYVGETIKFFVPI